MLNSAMKNQSEKKFVYSDDKNTVMIEDCMRKVLFDGQTLCEANNSKLIVVFNAFPNEEPDKDRLDELCKKICMDFDIPFFDIGEQLPKEDYFLRNDSHYSPNGNRWAAGCVYEYLKEHSLLEGGLGYKEK
jgi:hypothetical protein